MWPNNPADNAIKSASCVNNPAKNPSPYVAMRGWIAVSRPFSTSDPLGLYQLASTDPAAAHTSVWWMAGTNSSGGPGDEANTNPNTVGGCGGLYTTPPGGNLGNATANDFSKVPSIDAWGNDMTGTAYTTSSQFVDKNGNVVANPVYDSSTTLDQTKPTKGYHWALSFWNAADSAARRIRADVYKPNRTPADPNSMGIFIYVIGYQGNGGIDQGLCRRLANDKLADNYSSVQSGIYVPAFNKTELRNAFNTIYTAILRLAK